MCTALAGLDGVDMEACRRIAEEDLEHVFEPFYTTKGKGVSTGLGLSITRRLVEMMGEAMKIQADPESYHAALRDWVEKGEASAFALSPEEVIARSRPRDADVARGHAHFELATELESRGDHQAAIGHFREAQSAASTAIRIRNPATTA